MRTTRLLADRSDSPVAQRRLPIERCGLERMHLRRSTPDSAPRRLPARQQPTAPLPPLAQQPPARLGDRPLLLSVIGRVIAPARKPTALENGSTNRPPLRSWCRQLFKT